MLSTPYESESLALANQANQASDPSATSMRRRSFFLLSFVTFTRAVATLFPEGVPRRVYFQCKALEFNLDCSFFYCWAWGRVKPRIIFQFPAL
jgi:hypothetical protein